MRSTRDGPIILVKALSLLRNTFALGANMGKSNRKRQIGKNAQAALPCRAERWDPEIDVPRKAVEMMPLSFLPWPNTLGSQPL